MREYIVLPDEGRILDVGCGIGRHSRLFQAQYFGVDLNARYIAHAAEHYPAGHFRVMDCADMDFPAAFFDAVFCVGLMHHLPDAQVRAAAREMRRVARIDAPVWIIDAVLPALGNLAGYALMRMDRGGHARKVAELERLLSGEGFRLRATNLAGSYPYQRAAFAAESNVED